jgi:glycerate-2-kinase
MAKAAEEFGFTSNIISTNMYEQADMSLREIFNAKKENTVVLAAGEPMLEVTKKGGSGGRNLYMGLKAIKMDLLDDDSVFIPLASDGMDNSDAAGAIIDKQTIEKIDKLGLSVEDAIERFDAYPIFKFSDDMIMTGPTGANVSDLMILLTKK